jgi:hypothetical protein
MNLKSPAMMAGLFLWQAAQHLLLFFLALPNKG